MASGTFALGFRVARSLYSRWRVLAPRERERLAHLAEHAKERALELRGAADRQAAERELADANETLASAIVESAESDPELSASEVQGLRDELQRELERLASAEVRASRAAAESRRRAG